MAAPVREFKRHSSGWWCIIENGRWFPFSRIGKETLEEVSAKMPYDLWENHFNAYEGDEEKELVSKSDEPTYADYMTFSGLKTDIETDQTLQSLSNKFYDNQFIKNLKANTKSISLFSYSPLPVSSGPRTVEPQPEPPKKLPKVVERMNGRKFRTEE